MGYPLAIVIFLLFSFPSLGEEPVALDPLLEGPAPLARYPHPKAEGNLYYSLWPKGRSDTPRPNQRCILIHGYGVTQGLIDLLVHKEGFGAQLVRTSAALQGHTPVRAFIENYFGGPYLIEMLRARACDEVVGLFQESSQSSAVEMVKRTEAFLESGGCSRERCALIGHSRGGEVVDLIARRCAAKTGMKQSACLALSEVYTASSSAGGIGLSFVLLGGKVLGETALAEQFFEKLSLMVKRAPAWGPASSGRTPVLGELDLFSDVVVGSTHPAWYSLSPVAELDGELAAERFDDFTGPEGWFRGEWAASGSSDPQMGTMQKKDTSGWERLGRLEEEGRSDLGRSFGRLAKSIKQLKDNPTIADLMRKQSAAKFSEASQLLRGEAGRELFDLGQAEMEKMADGKPEVLKAIQQFSWKQFLTSDGLVEARVALRSCLQFNNYWGDRDRRCRLLPVNHYTAAGWAEEAAEHIVMELSSRR